MHLLKIANLSRSSYYHAVNHDYNKDDNDLVNEIREIRKNFKDYGYRRVTLELRNRGFHVNHKKVLRIMNENKILCDAYDKKVRKYNSYKGNCGKKAPNRLNRRFNTDRPFQKIVTDVTELRWGNETTSERAYLTTYMDLFNGEILTWNLSLHPTVEFILEPLRELIKIRPDLPYRMTIYSDQGFQYQNDEFIHLLKENKIFQSMSRKATCLDNACMESFFNQLKVGTTRNNHYQTLNQLQTSTKDYLFYYNNYRIKEKLEGLSPVKYRQQTFQLVA